jgi:hypothetical protein
VVDGREVVLVDRPDFDALQLSRRQLGAHVARASRLTQELEDTRAEVARLLGALRQAALHLVEDPCACVAGQAQECGRCRGGGAPVGRHPPGRWPRWCAASARWAEQGRAGSSGRRGAAPQPERGAAEHGEGRGDEGEAPPAVG